MANDLYRGYEIKPAKLGGFFWTDERGFDHFASNVYSATHADKRPDGFDHTGAAMDSIDAYKRNMRASASA
jgi:hypothetical protein